ncbi:DUF4276 family protein [Prosthecobacter fluviatilis]|uniref:DUF4276 family protein n=1 Tax=Prosthecobacter fluviatilis TaxID=445931 RepID=A0ABW0KZB2_9BACT
MKRIHIICEGQTEETFVNEVLAPYLERREVFPAASLVGKPGHKGGFVTTERMTRDIKLRLLGDRQAWCTTFFDFYGLDADFVGKQEATQRRSHEEKAEIIESSLRSHVLQETNDGVIQRFIPYVQMYEFEGLLFSDPARLASGIFEPHLEPELALIRNSFGSPEEINDSPLTAPSKRILKLMPGYEKPLYGSLAAIEIGIDVMRQECSRFDQWIQKMETAGGE